MLEGLEISEISLSSINRKKTRLDSDFYKKENLEKNNLLLSKPHKRFGNLINILTDYHSNGSYKKLNEHVQLLNVPDYAHMVRTTDFLRDDFEKDIISIDENAYNYLTKTKLFGGEILINKIGSYTGQSFLMPEIKKPSSLGMNIFMLSLKDGFSSKVYQTYLTTNIGRTLIEQQINGSSPKSIDKESVRDILVPLFSDFFQKSIDNLIEEVQELKIQSKKTYSQAENILLEEVGLQNFALSKEPVNVKSFKNSFATTGRLDAEYYQLKYEQVVNKIKTKSFDTLSNLVKIKKSIEPGSKNYVEDGLPFMRVADLSKNGLSEPQKFISEYFVKENQDKIKKLKPKKGTILFSKDGSVGIAYHLRQNYNGITSGAILHLNVKNEKRILPEYLTLALNSKVVQMQAERDAGGSIILHWRVGEIENVIVPVIDFDKQIQIADLIEQSFSLKKQSEHLLEVAKTAVEIAIEENEDVAIKYINHQSKKNG